jgi:hypothetical protein
MKTILALVLVFALSGCALSSTGKALNAGVIGSGIADYVSTRQGLATGRFVEANPVMGQGAIRQAVLKATGISGVLAATWALERKSHPVLAHVVRGVVTGLWSVAAGWNWRQQ